MSLKYEPAHARHVQVLLKSLLLLSDPALWAAVPSSLAPTVFFFFFITLKPRVE